MTAKPSLPRVPHGVLTHSWGDRLITQLRRWFELLDGAFEVTGELHTHGRRQKITFVTDATYTVVDEDMWIDVNRAGAVTLTFPDYAADANRGKRFVVQDASGGASGNNITLDTGSATFNGSATYVISTDYGRVEVIWNGSEYLVA